jgi:hypothetical protein
MKELRRLALCLLLPLLLAVFALAADGDRTVTTYSADDESFHPSFPQAGEAELCGGADTSAAENAILEAVKNRAEETDFFASPYQADDLQLSEKLFAVYYHTIFNHAEACFCVKSEVQLSVSTSASSADTGAQCRFKIHYLENADAAAYEDAVNRAYAACVCDGMTPLEKTVSIYSWVADNCQYDPYVANNKQPVTADGKTYDADPAVYTSYGVFVSRNAVCQGYALAMDVLLDRAGVPNVYTRGTVTGGGHAWNRVELGGSWYHVDATWGDAVYSIYEDVPGRVGYRYFLLSDQEMTDDTADQKHISWEDSSSYPCSNSYPDGELFWKSSMQPIYLRGGKLYYLKDKTLYTAPVGSDFKNETPVQTLTTKTPEDGIWAFRAYGDSFYYTNRIYYINGQPELNTGSLHGGAIAAVLPAGVTGMCGLRLSGDGKKLELVSGWTVKASVSLETEQCTDKNQPAYFTWSSLLTADNCAGADVVLHTKAESVRVLAIFCDQNGKTLHIAVLPGESPDADGICACKLPAATPAGCAQVRLFALDGGSWSPLSESAALPAA